jgi:hypothetical protein
VISERIDLEPKARITTEEILQAAADVTPLPIASIAKKDQAPLPAAEIIEDKPKKRSRSAPSVTKKSEALPIDEPVIVTKVVTKATRKQEVRHVQSSEVPAIKSIPSTQKAVEIVPMEQDDSEPEPSLFELAAAELHLPITATGPEPETVDPIEKYTTEMQSVYAEHAPDQQVVARVVEALIDEEADAGGEAHHEKVEQVTHFVAAMPEGLSEAIVVKFESGEPEEVEQIEQLIVQLATATDRLHNLAMSDTLESEEAVQIEALVEVWYAELCETIGVIVSPEDCKQFITLVKSAEYKLITDEHTQEAAVTIDHEAWYNPHHDFTGLAYGHVAVFIRQQLHSRLGGLSVKALVV